MKKAPPPPNSKGFVALYFVPLAFTCPEINTMLRSYRVSKGQRDNKGPGETYRERMRGVVKTLLMPQEALLITCVDGLDGRILHSVLKDLGCEHNAFRFNLK